MGRAIYYVHTYTRYPSYVSVSNYQSTTMRYRTKIFSPFPTTVVNLFFGVRRVYTLKHRFMVIPHIYVGNSWVRSHAITVQLQMPFALKGYAYAVFITYIRLYSFSFIY
jgi:hypothetical protein